MTTNELRRKYLEFFQKRGHAVIPSSSLIPENDSTSLFIGSGMQPLLPYFLGEVHPAGRRLVDSQKSFRSEDIEEVGDGRHTTFFEMLGNWSLGDSTAPDGVGAGYFKKEQLEWVFTFLVGELKLDPARLYVTVFRGNKELGVERDEESVSIWKNLFKRAGLKAREVDRAENNGLAGGRIFYYGEEKNWWSRCGTPEQMPVGEPGGPDSEIFYDLGANLGRHELSRFRNRPCHVNCDCGRFIEIGNSVFMQYIKTKNGFQPLPQKNVDFGGGLERMAMVVQGKNNIFTTDLFINLINQIERLSGKKYVADTEAFEVIADHIKAAVFIIGDDRGIVPSNTDRGYIVRRLIRRAIRYGRQLNISKPLWTSEVAGIVIHDYREVYPELARNIDFVIEQFKKEEGGFKKTLERGMKIFVRLSKSCAESGGRISGEKAFDLYQTYGFPIEITAELAKENGVTVDQAAFWREFKKHKELSRTASVGKFRGGLADAGEETTKLHTAAHLLLAVLRRVLGDHVKQRGSNITAERLRFDFCHDGKLTEEQKEEVERLVNRAIADNLLVKCEEMTLKEARKRGAMGVFGSKYGEKVRVYTIGRGDEVFSREICGGPHVKNTGVLGKFRIKKEQSSSAGVRRIKAVLEN